MMGWPEALRDMVFYACLAAVVITGLTWPTRHCDCMDEDDDDDTADLSDN